MLAVFQMMQPLPLIRVCVTTFTVRNNILKTTEMRNTFPIKDIKKRQNVISAIVYSCNTYFQRYQFKNVLKRNS